MLCQLPLYTVQTWEAIMEADQHVIAPIRTLLNLPAEPGERLPEEWKVVVRRVAIVHGVSVSHDIDPAGAPRLDVPYE